MVMLMLRLLQLGKLLSQSSLAFHSGDQLLAGQLTPRGSYDGSFFVMLPEHSYSVIQLILGDGIRAGKDDGRSGFYLVIIELAKVLHVDLDLAGVYHRNGIPKLYIVAGNLLHSADHIAKLAYAGGLDNNPVGRIGGNNLLQSFAEIAHQAAADTAGVHLGNVDSGILQKAAVNADLTKFIFDQHQLLALIAFGDHLFNKGGLTCAQKAGININLCHNSTFHSIIW